MFTTQSWAVPNPAFLESLDLAVNLDTLSERLADAERSFGVSSGSTDPFEFGHSEHISRDTTEGVSVGVGSTYSENGQEAKGLFRESDGDSNEAKLGKLLFRMDPAEAESFNRYRQEYNGYRRGAAHGAKGEVKEAQQVYGGKQENKRKREEDSMMRHGGRCSLCARKARRSARKVVEPATVAPLFSFSLLMPALAIPTQLGSRPGFGIRRWRCRRI